MNYLITYPSALEFWLSHNPPVPPYDYLRLPEEMLHSFFIIKGAAASDIYGITSFLNISAPVHIMVPDNSQRRKWNNCVFHKAPASFPANSIVRIADNLYIISPEMCFLLAARILPLTSLILLGFDLCAKFRPNRSEKYSQVSITPVTGTEKISKFLNTCSNIHGLYKARMAVRYVLNNSNSPMETKISMLAGLPLSLGGYGLPAPQLNPTVKLSPSASLFLGRDTCKPDIAWPDALCAIEYDSRQYHLEEDQFVYDKKRSSALALTGYTVLNVTYEQLNSFMKIEDFFKTLRHTLQLHSRTPAMEKYLNLRWKAVNEVMFGRHVRM